MDLSIALCLVGGDPEADSRPSTIAGVRSVELKDSTASPEVLAKMAEGHEVLVAVALSPVAMACLREASASVPGLLAVDSISAAANTIRLLQNGLSAADIAYPPLFTPDRLLTEPVEDSVKRWRVRLHSQEVGEDGPWLAIERDSVAVASQVLSPLEIEAASQRVGLPCNDEHRLLIGPCNWAGQGEAWARAAETHVAGVSARNVTLLTNQAPGPIFPTDVYIDPAAYHLPLTRVDLVLDMVLPATHLLIEDMRPFIGMDHRDGRQGGAAQSRREAEACLRSERRVAVVIHGSAGRSQNRHAALYPMSPFADAARMSTVKQEARIASVLGALEGLDVPIFVATVDMLDFVEEATWLPIVINPANFVPAPRWEPERRLKVMHMPSNDIKKGSGWVDEHLARLDKLGVIDYRRYSAIHPSRVPGLLRQVDVVVDQVSLGNVATLANQTMAAGRLSLGQLAPHVRRRYPENPPVVSVDPTSLSDVVWQVSRDPQRFEELAKAGPDFARRFHDGRAAAEALEPWLLQKKSGSTK